LKDLPKGARSCHGSKSIMEMFIRARFAEYKIENGVSGKNIPDGEVKQMTRLYEEMYKVYVEEKKQELEAKEERKRLKSLKINKTKKK
jgi:hypothetical protein